MTLKVDAKFKGKLTCGLKNSISNLVNLVKPYKDLDGKEQRSYVS